MVIDGGLYALASRGYWLDTGTPAQYLQANLDLIDGRRAVTSAAVLGEVDGATVHRSVVGEGAVVASGALVADSVVMPGARVGAGACVVRSIVGRGATIGAGAHVVGLSVVGDGIVVEPSARLVGRRIPDPDEG
jgi:ADP-glucose pyrophosphorylase